MAEREDYYKSFVKEKVKEHYNVKIDLPKSSESKLPKVQIDMQFEIPLEALKKGKKTSPFPFDTEINLVHIKAVNDKLTQEDFRIYLAELTIVAEKEKERKKQKSKKPKSTGLLIISAEEILKKGYSKINIIEDTKVPWIVKIKHDHPAYIFILDRLPLTEEYQDFVPFMTEKRLEKGKEELHKLADKAKQDKHYKFLLLCLRKLQPNFYKKEFGMSLFADTKEMAQDLFPEGSKKIKMEAGKELVLKHLERKFKKVSESIIKQLDSVSSLDDFDKLLEEVYKIKSIKSFEKILENLIKKEPE